MPVPDYQSLMLPLLQLASHGAELTTANAIESLAAGLHLTEEDRRERLNSGTPTFENRVGWAKTYLKKAGLIELTGRARFRITKRGLTLLRERPDRLEVKNLAGRFEELGEFLHASRDSQSPRERKTRVRQDPVTLTPFVLPEQTPEESLDASHAALHRQLATDLLERVKAASPRFFEQLVVNLLVAMGYGGSHRDAAEAVGRSGDEGIDGIIKEDKLGLDAVYIQAKRWEGTVGRPVVQAFAGALSGHKATKGVLLTTSSFSPDAREFVGRLGMRIVLIDGERLAELMIEHGVAVTEVRRYLVHRIDADYFTEE
jgi:restriction system protein